MFGSKKKLQGWLWIPLIELIMNPLSLTFSVAGTFKDKAHLAKKNPSDGVVEWSTLEVVDAFLTLGAAAFCLFALVKFLKRDPKTPLLMVIRAPVMIAIGGTGALVGLEEHRANPIDPDFEMLTSIAFGIGCTWNGLWALYFMKSERVKDTFGRSDEQKKELADKF